MRKSSKILAVVLCLVLLTGIIATMISAAETEINFPEYATPAAATVIPAYGSDFEEGSAKPGSFGASNGFMQNNVTVGGNTYAQITNINADGTLATHKDRSMGNLHSPYLVMGQYDYITIGFDIVADRYTDGTNIKTIEEYEALEDKTGYYPTFATTRFTMEAMGIVGYGDTSFLWIKQNATTKQWYVSTSAAIADATSYPLPTEAGVWTNITYAIHYDVNVTYTDSEGVKTVSFRQYEQLSAEEKAAATDVSVVVNSTLDIYVNGEFAFNIAAAGKNTATFTYDSFTATSNKLKFNQMQYGTSGSSRATTPVSFGIDNLILAGYVDGYTGDLATALANNTSLLDTNDAIFNQNYNKTKFVAATVTTAEGTYGYMTVEQAFNAAKTGDTVEILADNNATLTIDENSEIKSLTVKTSGKAFNYDLSAAERYECYETSAGVYTLVETNYYKNAYVGPVGATQRGSFYDYDTTGTSKFNAATDKGEITVANKTVNGNTYAGYTWDKGTTTSSGETIRLGQWYNTPIIGYDYITIDLDIVADQYRNTTDGSLITIEAYNALSTAEKANYEPAYHAAQFYQEYAVISSPTYDKMLKIEKVNGEWVLRDNGGKSFTYALPKEAGVWTHITWVTTIGNTVTYYTDDTKTTTATMSYADYVASEKGETYYKSINLSESTQSIYVNGKYVGDIASWASTSADTTAFASLGSVYYKYLFVKGAPSSSTSKFSQNFSMGFDNNYMHVYADGYTGTITSAKTTGLHTTTDTLYNNAYNKTGSKYTVGVINPGEQYGYKFTNIESAMSYAKDGATIELLANANATIDVTGYKLITVDTNGYSFNYATTDDNVYVDVKNGEIVTVKKANFIAPEYVGPTGATNLFTTNFENGKTANGFNAQNGVAMNILTANDNTYAQVTNWVDGAMVENTGRQYGSLHAAYKDSVSGDYFTYNFDIMSDKYTNGTDLITIEEYEALSDEAKAEYSLAYATTYYYMELPCTGNYQSLWLKNFDGQWYICSAKATASDLTEAVALPTEAGVWTNITMAFKTDVNVRYTDANGTKTVTYTDYTAISDKSGHTEATVIVNSDLAIYANGEYAFDLSAFDYTAKEYAFSSFTGQPITFKYMQMQAGQWSSSRVTTPMSICYDNLKYVRYEEGYNGTFKTAFDNRTALHFADSVFNATYNKTGTYTAAVYVGDTLGASYYCNESAYASVTDGATIELLADARITYSPLVPVTYVKTNGYNFTYDLPDGYVYKETDVKGTYVIRAAGPEDKVEVKWMVNGQLYATTNEIIGSTPVAPTYLGAKVHPWVTQTVVGWVNEEGGNKVSGAGAVFNAVIGYEATPEILMNITTVQAIITNTYIVGLTEAEMALVSNVSYTQNGNERWGTGSQTNVTIAGQAYYKFAETNRIVYNAQGRKAVLSFTYNGVDLSVEFICDAYAYFDAILGNKNYSTVEKELIYSALDYANAVGQYSGINPTKSFQTLVDKYEQYKATDVSTLSEIIATAQKDTSNMSITTGYNLSVADGYAARFQFILDTAKAGEDFDKTTATLTYTSLNGETVTVAAQSYDAATGTLNFPYSVAVYDVRNTLTLTIGEETATFNLASYVKALVEAGYAEDSAEISVAYALYVYSECSEAYKKS